MCVCVCACVRACSKTRQLTLVQKLTAVQISSADLAPRRYVSIAFAMKRQNSYFGIYAGPLDEANIKQMVAEMHDRMVAKEKAIASDVSPDNVQTIQTTSGLVLMLAE